MHRRYAAPLVDADGGSVDGDSIAVFQRFDVQQDDGQQCCCHAVLVEGPEKRSL